MARSEKPRPQRKTQTQQPDTARQAKGRDIEIDRGTSRRKGLKNTPEPETSPRPATLVSEYQD